MAWIFFYSFILLSSINPIQSNTITFFNACPSTSITLSYGATAFPTEETGLLSVGSSALLTISYPLIHFYLYDENHTLITSSSFTLTTANINGIGYVNYETVGCQLFIYSPSDLSYASKSVIVYINGATIVKAAYIGDIYQGEVLPSQGNYTEITSSMSTIYSNTNVKFCSGNNCVVSGAGTANIPIGSALFFIHYLQTTSTDPTSGFISFGQTGTSTISSNWECPDCDFDDDITLSTSVVVASVLGGAFGICLICGLGYLIYRCQQKKPENLPLNAQNEA